MTDIATSQHLSAVARQAARLMRVPLLEAFRSTIAVDYKRDLHDVVTQYDRQAEAAIRDFLLAEVPDSVVIGEEAGASGTGSTHWYVDPIDGTANFARGLAFWCMSVGAVIDDEIVAGAIYDPVADLMFSADLAGARVNDRPLRSRAIGEEKRATLITGYPVGRDFHRDGREPALANFAELVENFSTLRRPGSAALSLAHIAAGWTDAALGTGVNAWDVTAGIIILRQAGGSYEPLTLGKVEKGAADFLCPGYVAIGAGGNYPTLQSIRRRICAAGERAVTA